MGAIEKSNAIYLTIADGQISRRVQKPTDKSIQRTTKQGKIVNEEFYKGWKGKITNISVKDHPEFGKFWNVTLTDEDGDAIIQMNYSSGYASAFLKTLPNVDFSQEVIIAPHMKMEGDKKKTTIFITQHGKALKHAFTKDEPNGLPQLKQIKVKGKLTWDDSDLMAFLEEMVKDEILPQLKAGKPQPVTAGTASQDEFDEEVPF
jgi:hypothetical protein